MGSNRKRRQQDTEICDKQSARDTRKAYVPGSLWTVRSPAAGVNSHILITTLAGIALP